MEEWPPGGACRRVVGRSVITLPQFWSEPLAYALEDWCLPLLCRGTHTIRGGFTRKGDDALRSETRVASRRRVRVKRDRPSRKRFSRVRRMMRAASGPARDAGLRSRARRARSSGRSRRATRRCLTARARAAARPPDGSLVQNELGHRGVRTKRVVSSGEEARGKGTRARIRWTGAYLGMAFSLWP